MSVLSLGALPPGQNYPHLGLPCPCGRGLGAPSSKRVRGPSLPLSDPGPVLTVTIKKDSGSSRKGGGGRRTVFFAQHLMHFLF